MAGPTRDGDSNSLDDDTVAARWAELTASLGELHVPAEMDDDGRAGPVGTSPDTAGGAPQNRPGSGFPGTGDDGAGARPAGADRDAGDGAPDAPPALSTGPSGPPSAQPPGPRDYSPAEEDDEGYEPPDPEPLTHADPALTLGWVAALGSVLVGIVLSLVWRPVPTGMLAVLGLTLLGGVGLLLWRMPDGRDDDHDPSGGAVV
ncbi:hypothetical protein [Georgenia thermotolerans]|uniref:DUF308 domain-containing protein n=1 Tax=Georgenia thermotolerans TaxID=527326 RepID=A0A7J5UN81_9MICO|nr:hypothetical protein [Georgenia thermotolerans]KAE8763845.1 hypothetical protein GB883_12095 [Georgenia thermotolerans]